jgi:hypothetical protein
MFSWVVLHVPIKSYGLVLRKATSSLNLEPRHNYAYKQEGYGAKRELRMAEGISRKIRGLLIKEGT